MGTKICDMTPSMGFSVVLTASILVMMASITGLPASTTHCQVINLLIVKPNKLKGGVVIHLSLHLLVLTLSLLFIGDGYSWSKYSKRLD